MRLALVTTRGQTPSPVGAQLGSLLPALRERVELELFSDRASEGPQPIRDIVDIAPREFDQILFAIGNEAEHGFMLPVIRAFGGACALFSWRLESPARAAFEALERGGLRGTLAALREGGGAEMMAYRSKRGSSGAGAQLALNRSVVRFADAFLVEKEEMRDRILRSRNSPTPVATVPLSADSDAAANAAIETWMRALERFPKPRVSRRALVALAFERGRKQS